MNNGFHGGSQTGGNFLGDTEGRGGESGNASFGDITSSGGTEGDN